MNELSTEVKAKETHENATIYYSRAEYNLYKHVMEVKKIRDERYYRELGYETFDEYCQTEWGVGRQTMYERIQTAESFNEDDFVSYNLQFGHNKTLLLTRMAESEREQVLEKGIPTDEGYKPYDEATQQEINEYRRNAEEAEQRAIEAERAKQQAESQAEQAKRSEEIALRKLEEEQNKEPKVIEKEIVKEIDKTDYNLINKVRKEKNDLEMKLVDVEYQLEEMKNKYDGLDEFREELSRLEATKSNLLHSVNIAKITGEFSASVEEFIDTGLSKIMRVDIAEEINQNPSLSQAVKDDLDKVEMMLKECRLKLKGLNGYETIDVETI